MSVGSNYSRLGRRPPDAIAALTLRVRALTFSSCRGGRTPAEMLDSGGPGTPYALGWPSMRTRTSFLMIALTIFLACSAQAQFFFARDPGVRGGVAGAGGSFTTLTAGQKAFFDAGQDAFVEVEGIGDGLGPRFNLDSCAACHAQPATGGTSPAVNPQIGVATAFGAKNVVPSFIRSHGPVREARFKVKPDGTRDGGVHALFVISGRVDETGNASSCTIQQEDFAAQVARNNVIFRIPTPTFGLGLVEAIPDAAIVANQATNSATKTTLGILGQPQRLLPTGDPNRNGNDGTITRFGWKAQNKSLLLFAGEAYNVEQGISNELFQQERGEGGIPDPLCDTIPDPNDTTNFDATTVTGVPSDVEHFAQFMRFLDQPTPACTLNVDCSASINAGFTSFQQIGCAVCHTPSMQTDTSRIAALNLVQANLFSDLLVHNMGLLGDGIGQGAAGPNEFRTAPLWGVGQRIFFLHDGRTTNLVQAIEEHAQGGQDNGSEASQVIQNFNALTPTQRQNIINFLRS